MEVPCLPDARPCASMPLLENVVIETQDQNFFNVDPKHFFRLLDDLLLEAD